MRDGAPPARSAQFTLRAAPAELLSGGPKPQAPAGTRPRPSKAVSQTTAGFARDENGAVAAAVAYATAPQRWLYLTDEEIAAAVTEIATPAAGPHLADEVVADVSAARERLVRSPGRVWWLVRPLAWRVESFR
ncbi:MAG: hypothetical protein V9E99_05295 [Microthrixaceae bacterium]